MSKTKIIMHGCNGAMGQVISRLAAQSDSVEIVAGLDIADKGLYEYPVFCEPGRLSGGGGCSCRFLRGKSCGWPFNFRS